MEKFRLAAVTVVVLCWVAMVVTHLFRSGPRGREVRRGGGWRAGALLQALAVVLVWGVQRSLYTPLHPALFAAVAALGVSGVWLMTAAENALGHQFAYQARLVEGHELITKGPYSVVRHPIYLAFFAVIQATALTFSRWEIFPAFIALYWAGAALRIRAEERLLREAFLREYEEYARRVPSVIPMIGRRSGG